MSQLKDCKPLSLDKTDRLLLRLMCLAGDKTTRPEQISIWFGHGLSAYTTSGILGRELSYKNVRKRMQKLRSLGLIEDIKEVRRYRRAIKYKPTTLGIFQGILNEPASLYKKGRTSSSLPDSYIEALVEEEVKNLIFTIVTASTIIVEDPDTPNIKSIFPIESLTKDKKFMKTLQEMKKDFDNGYQKF